MSDAEPVELPLTLGRQIASARRNAEFSQADLGRRWNLHRTTISRWERDEDEGPSFVQMVDLSQLSGWPLTLFARAAAMRGPLGPDGGATEAAPGYAHHANDSSRCITVTSLFDHVAA